MRTEWLYIAGKVVRSAFIDQLATHSRHSVQTEPAIVLARLLCFINLCFINDSAVGHVVFLAGMERKAGNIDEFQTFAPD